MPKIDYQIRSAGILVEFLRKLGTVDQNVLVEIHPDTIIAKTHTPEKHVVKCVRINFDDVFSGSTSPQPDLIKVGLYNVSKINKIFGHFSPDADITLTVEYDKDKKGELVARSLNFHSSDMDITSACAQTTLFTYISDDVMDSISDVTESKFNFVLSRDFQSRLSNLLDIDGGKSFSIETEDDELVFKGQSFRLRKSGDDISVATPQTIEVSKKYIGFLDKETYDVYATDRSLIFTSQESNTTTVIGRVEPDDDAL